jgi:hypothetical protein
VGNEARAPLGWFEAVSVRLLCMDLDFYRGRSGIGSIRLHHDAFGHYLHQLWSVW